MNLTWSLGLSLGLSLGWISPFFRGFSMISGAFQAEFRGVSQ